MVEFSQLFKEPQGFPCVRQQEHNIHPLKGVGLVNMYPYRYPHHHKFVIEK